MASPNQSTSSLAVCAALACLWLAQGPGLLAQQMPLGRIKNFSLPEYFAPPAQNQVKLLIRGAEARPQDEGRFLIRELSAETFRENGERTLLIRAPECVYDPNRREANSAGPFQMHSGDGRLVVAGEGFLWRPDDSILIISNRVHTMIKPKHGKTEKAK